MSTLSQNSSDYKTSCSPPPQSLKLLANLFGGSIACSSATQNNLSKQTNPDTGNCIYYQIDISNNDYIHEFNPINNTFAINNFNNVGENIRVEIFINSKHPYISIDLPKDSILPGFAVPVSLDDHLDTFKNIKYIINNNGHISKVLCIYSYGFFRNETLSNQYVIIIPTIVKNKKDGISNIKRSKYYISINNTLVKFSCPNILKDNKRSIFIPFFIIPRKHYPIWVYMHALYLYISTAKSQRDVLKDIKLHYKYSFFSIATLSRTFNSSFNDILFNQIKHITDFDDETSSKYFNGTLGSIDDNYLYKKIGVGKGRPSPPSEPCWRFSRTRLSDW
jgi:hypothetical protein